MSKKPARALLGSVIAAGALVLAGCGAVEAPAGTPVAADGTDAGAASPAAAAAKEQVERVSAAVDTFAPPGPAISGLSSLAGKTVYYIPANYKIPMFHTVGDALGKALATAGVKLQVCDAQANPSSAASCLGQAVDAKAAAVISGSLPEEFASVAFKSVKDAGIPLLFTQTAPAGPGDPKKVGYLTPDNVAMQSWNAAWVTADSGAAADVLVVKVTDTPATILWMEMGALKQFKDNCPECKVTVVDTNTGQLQKLPSLVSSAMVRKPSISHVQVEFDITVQPTVQGLQSAGKADSVKISSQDGTLPVMQMLGEGRSMGSVVGFNQDALGWYAADQVLRMMSGTASVQNLEFPYRRLFTRDNVKGLDLTPAGESSGSWYGATDYQDGFKKLWGVS